MVPNGWTHGLFNDGIELISGQHVDAKFVNNSGIGKPYLTGPADFPDGKIIVTKYTEHAKKECLAGDLLITVKGSGTGKVIEADGSYAISRQLMAIRATKFDSKFCFYNLVASVKRYEDAAAGLIPGISRDDVLNTPIMVPPLPEQRKIAQILSTWDKAITTTERLIASSQQQKKSLMQQLLTGKKRLLNPETGKAFEGEWEEVKLNQLALITMGSSPKSEAYNEIGEGLPLLQGNADIKSRRSAPRIYTNQITKQCSIGDILLSVRAPVGSVAKSDHKACIGRGIASIKANKSNSQEYLYQWLLAFEPKWEKLSQGSTFEAVNSNDIKTLNILAPTLTEQQIIASVLTAADKEIELLQAKLAHLKEEKKALMQQLLTGKRRVKIEEMEIA